MVTYDVLNMPITAGVQSTFQASVIRFGKSYQAERGEIWTTLGGDIAIPMHGSVSDTLGGGIRSSISTSKRRDNFNGFAGRARNFVSVSSEYLTGPWVYDLTTTKRWTTDSIMPTQKDTLYMVTAGHELPAQTLGSLSVSCERVDDRVGVYAGFRLTKTFTTCARCLTRGRAY